MLVSFDWQTSQSIFLWSTGKNYILEEQGYVRDI